MQTSIDIDLRNSTLSETFSLAVHHLQIAASLFEAIPCEEFEALSTSTTLEDYFYVFHAMLDAATLDFKTECWARQVKDAVAAELASYEDDDPVGLAIWEAHAVSLREGLEAAGWSEERVDEALGDLGATIWQWRQDVAERAS